MSADQFLQSSNVDPSVLSSRRRNARAVVEDAINVQRNLQDTDFSTPQPRNFSQRRQVPQNVSGSLRNFQQETERKIEENAEASRLLINESIQQLNAVIDNNNEFFKKELAQRDDFLMSRMEKLVTENLNINQSQNKDFKSSYSFNVDDNKGPSQGSSVANFQIPDEYFGNN